jgi:hypothetical protein
MNRYATRTTRFERNGSDFIKPESLRSTRSDPTATVYSRERVFGVLILVVRQQIDNRDPYSIPATKRGGGIARRGDAMAGEHQTRTPAPKTLNPTVLRVARDLVSLARSSYRGIARAVELAMSPGDLAALRPLRRAIKGRSVDDFSRKRHGRPRTSSV